MQILDDGNVFAAWWNHSLQSEYSSDGELLMQARWKAELRSYRSYKFSWVGRPTQPPDVHSEAIVLSDEDGKDSVSTVVFVSWNGATEVKHWNMYKTTSDGESRELVASVQRQDFETIMTYKGFASYVIVEGVDADDNAFGESRVVQTISPDICWAQTYWRKHTGLRCIRESAMTPITGFQRHRPSLATLL